MSNVARKTDSISQRELDFRTQLASRLTGIEGKIDTVKTEIMGRIDTLSATLNPLVALKEQVQAHEKQISFWRGAVAVLYALVLAFGAVLAKIMKLF